MSNIIITKTENNSNNTKIVNGNERLVIKSETFLKYKYIGE
jgi:hypothetical protein